MTGSVGKNYRVEELPEVDCFLNQRIAIIRSIKTSTKFIDTVMASSSTVAMHRGHMKSTNGNISLGDVKETLVPLPSSQEQQEIVRILSALDSGETDGPVHPVVTRIQKLEHEFRALAEEYESQEKWLAELRSALLQEAISGQLTADWRAANPHVEPAHVLLERIAEEKAELIRTKQIRKEKPLPPIAPDEVRFDIPSSWEWCGLGNIAFNFDHLRVPLKKADRDAQSSNFDYYGASGVIDSVSGCTHHGDFLLIGEDGSNLRNRNHPIAFKASGKFWLNNHAHALQFQNEVLTTFVMQAIAGSDISKFVSGGFQPKLSQANMNRIPIPFPPETEQQEIVQRLEVQLGKVEALQQELERSKEAAQLLIKSKLAEVFEPAMAD